MTTRNDAVDLINRQAGPASDRNAREVLARFDRDRPDLDTEEARDCRVSGFVSRCATAFLVVHRSRLRERCHDLHSPHW
jgi:hypothetical protein